MEGSQPHFESRYLRRSLALAWLTGVVLITVTGCAALPMEDASASASPWEQDQPWRQVDSSVLYTPEALGEMAWVGQSPDDARWYDSRNDYLNSVAGGPQARIIYERSTTYSNTSINSSNGRVYDNSHTHTYTRRIEERAR